MSEPTGPAGSTASAGSTEPSEPTGPIGWWSALRLHPALALDRRAVLSLGVLLLLAAAYALQHFWLGRPRAVPIPVAAAATLPPAERSTGAGASDSTGPPAVVVDVEGKVHNPGLRSLPNGSRVADALRAAGGPLADTDADGLNLARVLCDGEQILVGVVPTGPAPGERSPNAPLNLNRATAEQLDALPGVGPALARRIVLYRQEHGSFRSLDQLRQIGGVGERKLQELRPLLVL